MKIQFLFILILFTIIVLFKVDEANGYCCKVDSFIRGHPPDCNIFGCNCDCDKCESVVDKGCCLAEKTGIGLCNNKRKRSLMEQDLKSFFGEEYEKLMKKND